MSVVRSQEIVDGQDLETPTWVTSYQGLPRTVNVRRCRLEVVAGVDQGKIIEIASPSIQIGRTGSASAENQSQPRRRQSLRLALRDQDAAGRLSPS